MVGAIDMAAVVIAALPDPDGGINPPKLPVPEGMNYLWHHTALLGQPDLRFTKLVNDDGWAFVQPSAHPDALAMTVGEAIDKRAFCLLEKPTNAVNEQRAKERAPHMDLDFRALSILERYTGDAPIINIGGTAFRASAKRIFAENEEAPPPLNTLEEVRAELSKRFAEADVRLFMQRHFGA